VPEKSETLNHLNINDLPGNNTYTPSILEGAKMPQVCVSVADMLFAVLLKLIAEIMDFRTYRSVS